VRQAQKIMLIRYPPHGKQIRWDFRSVEAPIGGFNAKGHPGEDIV